MEFLVEQPICLHSAAVESGEAKQQERGWLLLSFIGVTDAHPGTAVGNWNETERDMMGQSQMEPPPAYEGKQGLGRASLLGEKPDWTCSV